MAKLKSTKWLMKQSIVCKCWEVMVMEEYPLARLLRDSRLGPIGGGTSEILKEILSKMIIDNKNYKPAVKVVNILNSKRVNVVIDSFFA
jgi:hypothetical protein